MTSTLEGRDPTPADAASEIAALLADPRLVAALRRMQAKLERLPSRLYDVCDDVDLTAKGMGDLVERLTGASVVVPSRRPRRSPAEEQLMRAEAEAGVPILVIKRNADGAGQVSVNCRQSFGLPQLLTTLLAVLAGPGGDADDGLVGWRTKSEVATALNKKTGGAVGPGAVPKLVHKLRKAFRAAGENWFLIQTNRERGVRVAVRG